MEVAQIGKSICNRVNYLLKKKYTEVTAVVDSDLVQAACLAHDLGHPPFGHQGESELDLIMKDFGGFEGNAQTLRILAKLEKKEKGDPSDDFGFTTDGRDFRFGLNLCSRTLASIIKYDYEIPLTEKERQEDLLANKNPTGRIDPCKGYYKLESDLVRDVRENVSLIANSKLNTIEMQIMDIADDIAYSTYDFEDSLKGGFINVLDLSTGSQEVITKVARSVNRKLNKNLSEDEIVEIIYKICDDIMISLDITGNTISDLTELTESGKLSEILSSIVYRQSKRYAFNGYYRTQLTSRLVGKFIRSVNVELDIENPAFSRVFIDNEMKEPDHIEPDVDLKIEVLKRFTYEYQISSNRLKIAEYRGRDMVRKIFDKIYQSDGELLPADYNSIFKTVTSNYSGIAHDTLRKRVVCDFISSTTDRYAVELYGRLFSENPQTIFKSW